MEEKDTSLKEKLEDLAAHTKDLAETGYKLAILEATEKYTKIISNVIVVLIIFFLLNAFLLFIGFGLAYWIADAFNDNKIGFFVISAIYFLLILLLFSIRKKVIVPFFMNMFVKKIYE